MDIKRLLLIFLSALWCFNISYAATNADYAMLPERQKVSISPDGSKVVYQYNKDDRRTAVVYDIDKKQLLKAFDLEKLNARSVYFLTNNYVILKVSEVTSLGTGMREYSVAYSYDIAAKKLRRTLTLGDNIYSNQTGLGNIVGVSDDGKYAYMPAYTDSGDYAVNYSVMRVNLKTGKNPRAVYKGDSETYSYYVDAKGKPLAQTIMDNERNTYSVRGRSDKNRLETIFKEDTDQPPFGVYGTSPDQKSLFVSYRSDEQEYTDVKWLSLQTGEFSEPEFTLANKDIDRVYRSKNRVVQGVRYSGFSPSYHFLDAKLQQRVQEILGMFNGHSVWVTNISDDLKNIVVLVEGPEFAGDFYVFREGKAPVAIGGQRPNIKPADIQPQAKWAFKAADGLEIPVLLTIPRAVGAEIKSLPTVVLPHGGPASHDTLGFDWLSQVLAKQGYLVIQPQFRGSTGFGNTHYWAGHGEWGQKMQSDVTESVEKLISAGYVDPSRVCIMGWSYGGYAALAGGAFTPDLYRCVVSINGVSDLRDMLAQEKRDHSGSSWVVSYWENQMAGDKAVTKDYLDSISPAANADQFKAPVLLIHGKDDQVVKMAQSDEMAKQLKKLNKPVTYHKFKGESHGLNQVGSRIEMMDYVLPFLAEHLNAK